MNCDTGALYQLPAELHKLGAPVTEPQLVEALVHERNAELERALEATRVGQAIVGVSEEAARIVKLGQRERARQQRRRKARRS